MAAGEQELEVVRDGLEWMRRQKVVNSLFTVLAERQ